MTTITFSRPGAGRWRVRAEGHATGSEAVCAAVSALVYALAGYLMNLERHGSAQVHTRRLDSADAEIEAGGGEAVRAAFELTCVGLRQIAERYGDFLRVEHDL